MTNIYSFPSFVIQKICQFLILSSKNEEIEKVLFWKTFGTILSFRSTCCYFQEIIDKCNLRFAIEVPLSYDFDQNTALKNILEFFCDHTFWKFEALTLNLSEPPKHGLNYLPAHGENLFGVHLKKLILKNWLVSDPGQIIWVDNFAREFGNENTEIELEISVTLEPRETIQLYCGKNVKKLVLRDISFDRSRTICLNYLKLFSKIQVLELTHGLDLTLLNFIAKSLAQIRVLKVWSFCLELDPDCKTYLPSLCTVSALSLYPKMRSNNVISASKLLKYTFRHLKSFTFVTYGENSSSDFEPGVDFDQILPAGCQKLELSYPALTKLSFSKCAQIEHLKIHFFTKNNYSLLPEKVIKQFGFNLKSLNLQFCVYFPEQDLLDAILRLLKKQPNLEEVSLQQTRGPKLPHQDKSSGLDTWLKDNSKFISEHRLHELKFFDRDVTL